MLNNTKQAQGQPRDLEFNRVRDESVVSQPRANKDGLGVWSALQQPAGPILPPWGTRQREWALRLWDRHTYSTLWQGAVDGLLMRWCATDWVIDGGKILANKYQRMFRTARSGEWVGWDPWLASLGREYLRQDGGAWIEVIGTGDPRGEVDQVTGLGVLPSYNVWPTGDPDYPCVYWDRDAGYHLMPRQRVIHLVDMPDADNLNPGYGLCALSRSIAVLERQMREQRYISLNLNDIPSSGMVIINNGTKEQVQLAFNAMQERISTDEPGEPGKVAWLESMNPAYPMTLENFTFARPPEKFDWDTYVRIDVNMMALAIGEDPQDLWPLSSSSMGSGQQSEILSKKAKGKMYGHFLKQLERELNNILPESLEFQFKISDPEEAKREAEVATAWATAVITAGSHLGQDEGRQLLADQSEAFNSVMTNAAGEIVELPDTDVRPVNAPGIQPNTDPALPPKTEQVPVTADSTTTNSTSQKDIQSTRLDFEGDFDALVESARGDDVSRRRFGTIARDLLRKYGDLAYRDGMKAGGVETDLDETDKLQYATLLAQQSVYVTNLGDALFKGSGISNAQAANKSELWFNKSIQPFYQAGLASADNNGLYEWLLGRTEKHCTTCLKMNGQKHRLKAYVSKGILPQSDALDCGGWNCDCKLKKTNGYAEGDWV